MTTDSTTNKKKCRKNYGTDRNNLFSLSVLRVCMLTVVYVPRILFEHNINERTITWNEDKNSFKPDMCVCPLLRNMFYIYMYEREKCSQ